MPNSLFSNLESFVLFLIYAVKTVITFVPQIIEGKSISHLFNYNQLHVCTQNRRNEQMKTYKKSWETLHHWILTVMKIAINGIANFL
jgi:hypothetical protein